MLRSSFSQGRQLLLSSARQRAASQWLTKAGASSRLSGQRFFADVKPTPATPSSDSVVPPETAPKPSPSEQQGSQTPPPPPPPASVPKTGRFRRFLLYLLLTSGLAYGGGVFLALKFDNFHDFFTEYIPYGEEAVLYFEERDFYRRFPNTLKSHNPFRATPPEEGNKVTIPGKSGLSSKIAEEDAGADLSQKGPHMSATGRKQGDEAQIKTAAVEPEKKTAAVQKAKADKAVKDQGSKRAEKKADEAKQSAVTPLEFAQVNEGDEAIVQELVKTFNDIITVISADEAAGKYTGPVQKAKEELQKIGEKIIAVREEARRAAQNEIKQAHETFDESARELIRRFEEARAADAAQYREEFEMEREKLAIAYQDKIKTELLRAQEVAEQRLRNELVEQAIELNRKYLHEVKDLVEREREGRLSKLNELTSNVSELEKLTTGWRDVIDTNLKTQQLQVAVDAVRSVLERSAVPRPFVRELVAVKELAGDDPVVEAAIASINPTAYQRGIPSTAQVIERFRRVADEVRKASLLPEDAGIASHAASLVLSKVMFKKDAVAGSDDVESVLVRTENLLEEGNIDAAAREMNSLKGWAKILSKDWLAEVRRVLEVKQALETAALMSQRTAAPPTPPDSMSGASEGPRRSATLSEARNIGLSDRLDGTKAPQMSEERASGELEGSTLGSSSRDGDRSRTFRRTQGSGGFLLDSTLLPRSKSLRQSEHRPRRSDSDRKEKRERPESEIVVPKKRSRFPWSRRKEPRETVVESPKASSSVASEGDVSHAIAEPSQAQQDAASSVPQATAGPPIGLDRDSLQIVNLALNLSESRKMGSLVRSNSNRLSSGRWASASATHPDGQASIMGGFGADSAHSHRSFTQPLADDRMRGLAPQYALAQNTPSSVLPLLPRSVDVNALPYGFSDSTLARADRARRHFELFTEYLRLLPSLPPLQTADVESVADARSTDSQRLSGRAYNPLQSIRNRKVRFRERCPIDAESQGWYDVERVREWVDSVEVQYSGQTHSPFECLNLPQYKKEGNDASHDGPYEEELFAASPPSSLRRASRASSVKARRPRSDWLISPAELIADAAWLEEGLNKSKAVDKDGNSLYPDPTALFSSDANLEPPSIQEETRTGRHSVNTDRPASSTSLADGHPGLSAEFKPIGRGRQRHRLQSPTRLINSRNASDIDTGSGRHRFGRSRSSSSGSDLATNDKAYWNTDLDHAKSPRRSMSPRRTGPMPTETPSSRPYQSRRSGGRTRRDDKSSVSSVPSLDDRYDPLTSLAHKETRDSHTPAPVGYFPSIASNLSSPSSRSPSPSKRMFSRAIVSRRDRSKSDPRAGDPVGDRTVESEFLHKNGMPSHPDPISKTGRLEPSPIPDRVSPAYLEERNRPQGHTRKGSIQQESKLRGIFKGPGKIAEKVGNEVSKMGGLILKKDHVAHSRQSSFATSLASDDDHVTHGADMPREDKKPDNQVPSLRLPPTSEEAIPPAGKDMDPAEAKYMSPSPSPFASPSRQGDNSEEGKVSNLESPSRPGKTLPMDGIRKAQKKEGLAPTSNINRLDVHPAMVKPDSGLGFGPELQTVREQIKRGQIKDPTVPYSLTRPPVTGLAQAKASHSPAPRNRDRDLTPQGQPRSWSISERSIAASTSSGIPGKREVERSRALLLSSGIKAREIARRSESVRSPPPEFLRRACGPNAPNPTVPRLREYDVAVDNLLKHFEQSHERFQKSMSNYPGTNLDSLKSQLSMLEALVNNSLNPRVRAAADDAENLSVQLNTTSTLAVKQLSDTLDKGIRKRHRRLRWIRRTGFVMLEWALVGVLWWVWLIVMIFKGFRGVLRGVISGVKWVLWL
ncbi:mitochondrial inner membrane protein-domain-containing protein [Aspergillus ambiguus]|uniref:MICOS complex subunit MIC60 n=1 Tax=Aspergillus ambiguus TaxID=176160 RepID=UPI003CCE0DEC